MRSFVEQYSTADKSGWGQGPWLTEPDKVVWVDEATDLDCMAHRGPLGAWCAYVGVPEGHPAYGQGYDDVDVDAHGGLTYAAGCQETDDPAFGICHVPQEGRPAVVWWLGFDCHHFMDYAPRMKEVHAQIAADVAAVRDRAGHSWDESDWQEVYRDLEYVIAECETLAAQLADYGTLRLAPGRAQDAV